MPTSGNNNLHLAIALDGAGWHPAAWREPDARPTELFTPRYWVDLVQQAEHGLANFVTIEDGLRLQSDHPLHPDDRTNRVRGRLDATLIAARVAPVTSHIGLSGPRGQPWIASRARSVPSTVSRASRASACGPVMAEPAPAVGRPAVVRTRPGNGRLDAALAAGRRGRRACAAAGRRCTRPA